MTPPPVPDPRRLGPGDPMLGAVFGLIRTTFAYMEGRIDPPSSMHRLTREAVAEQAARGEVWAIVQADRPVACVFLSPRPPVLYLGKLAVAPTHRGRGYARRLVALAEARARALGLDAVELESRVELTENHSAFAALGFRLAGERAHPGYDRATSLTFVKPL